MQRESQASNALLMARRSRELRAQGRDIIDLSLGEPDHEPPTFALEAARKLETEGRNRDFRRAESAI